MKISRPFLASFRKLEIFSRSGSLNSSRIQTARFSDAFRESGKRLRGMIHCDEVAGSWRRDTLPVRGRPLILDRTKESPMPAEARDQLGPYATEHRFQCADFDHVRRGDPFG